jgi:iron complex transport system ATP-binding protein
MLGLLKEHFCTVNRALLLVLHDINLARRIASHLLLLKGDGNWLGGDSDTLGTAQTLGEVLDYPLRESATAHGRLLEIDYPEVGLD